MPAPSPDLIATNPGPLNAYRRFPFFIDAFPADLLLSPSGANLAPREEPAELPENPARYEQR